MPNIELSRLRIK